MIKIDDFRDAIVDFSQSQDVKAFAERLMRSEMNAYVRRTAEEFFSQHASWLAEAFTEQFDQRFSDGFVEQFSVAFAKRFGKRMSSKGFAAKFREWFVGKNVLDDDGCVDEGDDGFGSQYAKRMCDQINDGLVHWFVEELDLGELLEFDVRLAYEVTDNFASNVGAEFSDSVAAAQAVLSV